MSNKKYMPLTEQYGWYDKYNFYKIYEQHNPLNTQDIDGAQPNTKSIQKSNYNYIDVRDIDGAYPKQIFGYTGHRPEIIKANLDRNIPYNNHSYVDQSILGKQFMDTHNRVYEPITAKQSAFQIQEKQRQVNPNLINVPNNNVTQGQLIKKQEPEFERQDSMNNSRDINSKAYRYLNPELTNQEKKQQESQIMPKQQLIKQQSPLAKSGSQTVLGTKSIKAPKEYYFSRKNVFDDYRNLSEYRDTYNNPQNFYYYGYNYHKMDELPGMQRALDFTPSTDLGQQYFDFKNRFYDQKSSSNIGYAPAFQSISHVNNPKAHREQNYKSNFDFIKSSYKG